MAMVLGIGSKDVHACRKGFSMRGHEGSFADGGPEHHHQGKLEAGAVRLAADLSQIG